VTAAEELLDRLAELGASVSPDGDRLLVRAGASGIPPALIARLRATKPDVIAALSSETRARQPDPADRPDTPNCRFTADGVSWRHRFAVRTVHWELGGYRSLLDAQRLAFAELLDEFREDHGRRWPVWRCAGCDEPIGGLSALTLADGNRVHFDEANECLIGFGRRWHNEVIAGLRALGLEPPTGFAPP
jgi:TubC N-terminal docking domain